MPRMSRMRSPTDRNRMFGSFILGVLTTTLFSHFKEYQICLYLESPAERRSFYDSIKRDVEAKHKLENSVFAEAVDSTPKSQTENDTEISKLTFDSLSNETTSFKVLLPGDPLINLQEDFGFDYAHCNCKRKYFVGDTLKELGNEEEAIKFEKRRYTDMLKYYKRNYFAQLTGSDEVTTAPTKFLQFKSSGLSIEPRKSVNISVQILNLAATKKVKIEISSRYGVFDLWKQVNIPGVTFRFDGFSHYHTAPISVQDANTILNKMKYRSQYYDARPFKDIVHLKLHVEENVEQISFPINIGRKRMPILNYNSGNLFEDKVTIVTKTFMRYKCVESLLKSIKNVYPKIAVIIADDSPADLYEEIDTAEFPTVKQYRMPPFSGWFAGRALAISQVETDYFIWMDDDFEIDPKTDLRKLFNVIEDLNYDIVSGHVGVDKPVSNFALKDHFSIDKKMDGFCYKREHSEVPITFPNYPECQVTDVTENFFIARTSSAGTVRMDPKFKRTGHREWFIDGIGFLRVARCEISPIRHATKQCHGHDDVYMQYREKTDEIKLENQRLWFYRSYLNCMAE